MMIDWLILQLLHSTTRQPCPKQTCQPQPPTSTFVRQTLTAPALWLWRARQTPASSSDLWGRPTSSPSGIVFILKKNENENMSDNLLTFSWKSKKKQVKINAECKTTMKNMLISGRIQKKKKAPLSWRSPSQSSFSFCKEIPHHFSCSNANK